MPSYFVLHIELAKTPTVVYDFCHALIHIGPKFKSGFWGFENDSFEKILRWNQDKLNHNFQLGWTEHYSHDYRQMLLEFGEFSEVRLFISNLPQESTFYFCLILPEDDFVEFGKESGKTVPHILPERMSVIRHLAKNIWECTDALAIQTGWECSDLPPHAVHLAEGAMPQAEPFCIIPKTKWLETYQFPYECINRSGILIENADNWKKCTLLWSLTEFSEY